MSSNYIYRLIKETDQDLYNPAGQWQEIRHISSSLTSDTPRNRVNGLAAHKGLTASELNFETVSGEITMLCTKSDLEFLVSIIAGNVKVGNTYNLGGSILKTLVIEQYDVELDTTVLYRCVGLKSLNINFQFGTVTGVSATFTGGYTELPDTRPSLQGIVVRNSDDIQTSITEDIGLFTLPLFTEVPLLVRSGEIVIDNGLQTINPLNKDYDVPYGVGNLIPTGVITVYSDLPAFNLQKSKMDSEPFEIVFSNTDFKLSVKRAYLGGNIPSDSGENTEVNINLQFEGIYDDTSEQIATIEFL